jgi:Undecaprenyl-phosphate glucose phosphotransferase
MEMEFGAVTSRYGATDSAHKPYSVGYIADILRALDLGVFLAVGIVVFFVYIYPYEPEAMIQYMVSIALAGLITGVLFHWFGIYSGSLVFSRRLRMGQMLAALMIAFALLLSIAFALKISSYYSRVWVISWFLLSAGLLTLGRYFLGRWIVQLAKSRRFANRTVIIGTGEQARRLAAHLQRHDLICTRVIGYVDNGEPDSGWLDPDKKIRGGIDTLIGMIRDDCVEQVIIALPWSDESRIRDVAHRLAVTPISIRLAPDLAAFDYTDRAIEQIAGLPMLHLYDRPISGWRRVSKAIEDKVLAAIILFLASPIMLVSAILIKLESPGPVLFRQPRYGFNNNLIPVLKLRTMYQDQSDPAANVLTTRGDPRVTRIGSFLRRMSLDELPQLLNVLSGQMSLVGPRPHAVAAKAAGQLYYDTVEQYAARHRVKPGITGWAQVNGYRGETDTVEKIRKRVEYDLYYIDNWSIWLDLKIIVKTAIILFKDEHAF